MEGYLVINAIIGGQTLAEVSPRLDATLGIVIISLICLAVCSFVLFELAIADMPRADHLLRVPDPSLVGITRIYEAMRTDMPSTQV